MEENNKRRPMTIYEIVNDICNRKSNKLSDDIRWEDLDASSYILRRFVSMTNASNACIANDMFNRLGDDTSDDSKFMYHAMSAFMTPYNVKKKFKYFKRAKTEHQPKNAALELESEKTSLSCRERSMYDKYLQELKKNEIQ